MIDTMIHILVGYGYADDVAVLEPGTSEGINRLEVEVRVNSISLGSRV